MGSYFYIFSKFIVPWIEYPSIKCMARIRRQYTHDGIASLPDTIGIYILHRNSQYAYIGKSVHVRTRVYEHLRDGRKAQWVTMIPTRSESEAFNLEKQLVGSVCPKENELLKKGCAIDPDWWDKAVSFLGF